MSFDLKAEIIKESQPTQTNNILEPQVNQTPHAVKAGQEAPDRRLEGD